MVNSNDDGRSSDTLGLGDSQQPPHVVDVLPEGRTVMDIDLRSLPAGTQLSVNTQNSQVPAPHA